MNHVIEVVVIFAGHGAPTEAAFTGLLHDTVEDAEVTQDDLVRKFAPAIAAIVAEATDERLLPKKTRVPESQPELDRRSGSRRTEMIWKGIGRRPARVTAATTPRRPVWIGCEGRSSSVTILRPAARSPGVACQRSGAGRWTARAAPRRTTKAAPGPTG